MKYLNKILIFFFLGMIACSNPGSNHVENNLADQLTLKEYFDNTGRDDVLSAGVKMIPIQTASGEFKVWTKRVGNNPRIKVLLLHGGPGGRAA